eukprot:TRINITY_DN687_c0_g1_i1.p1 TRINITY_DN687_c0_g1~~TRINITY_DN687_c0_g1_i1.p1  ORF type:complete len:429 (+),score=85.40 TRINITY_DN687_c0_g1_i1:15-1301(+)
MAAFPYLQTVLGFRLVNYIFETYLDVRQHAALKLPTLPPTLQGVVSPEKFKKSQAYTLDKSNFGFLKGAIGTVESLATLWFFLLPWMWEKSEKAVAHFGYDKDNEILVSIVFAMITSLWNQVLDLPFAIYGTFVLEERHGFNKQTPFLFVKDMIISLVLGAVIGLPLMAAFIYIVKIGGPYVAVYLWVFMLVVSLVFQVIYPVLIAPLFNKFTPLPDGELRTDIEKLAASLKFPLTKLFVVDGSLRSSHSNAYMYGFWKNKRIVIYDTLLEQCEKEEVVAVLGHELGHWKLRHTQYTFVAAQVLLLSNFLAFTFVRNTQDMYTSFGFSSQPVLIGFLLFESVKEPLEHLLGWGFNVLSRTFEFQADRFALDLGYGTLLRKALIKMQEENLSAMNVDPLYSAYHHSHPHLAERLGAIDKAESSTTKKTD